MNKQELIDSVSQQTGLSKEKSRKAVEAFLSNIEQSLVRGQKVHIKGFAHFQVRQAAPKRGRNPLTGQPLVIGPRKVPKMVAGKWLVETIRDVHGRPVVRRRRSSDTDDPGPSAKPKMRKDDD
jgi:DNA-binding protein HU-beta